MTSQYSQRIAASDLSRAAPSLTNFGHTFGHTRDLDLDSNTYPDLIVGAYSAKTVVVLRSRPVINIISSLVSEPGTINPANTSCYDNQANNCFRLRVCMAFSAEPTDRQDSRTHILCTVGPHGQGRRNGCEGGGSASEKNFLTPPPLAYLGGDMKQDNAVFFTAIMTSDVDYKSKKNNCMGAGNPICSCCGHSACF